MMIQFERRFFRYKDEVGKYIADTLANGGSWDFTVAVVEDTEDKPGGFEVSSNPLCIEWKETMIVQGDNLDGKDYVVCVPDGTVDLVSWSDLSIERSQKRPFDRKVSEESVKKARERMNQMDLVSWGFVRDLNGESMHAEFRGKCW